MSGEPAQAPTDSPILFFDGVCGVCNGFVDTILRREGAEALRFAPLQGEAAAARGLRMTDWREASFTLETREGRFEGADAVLRVFVMLGGGWRWLGRIGSLVPRAIRDRAYRAVARRRYGWFGEKERCRIPTASERARFLD